MFEYILLMLVAVLVSSFVCARFPKIPTSLVQIALGIGLTLLPLSFDIHLEPELFMVLFIAPLLFEDAKKADKPSLWKQKYPILLLAVGLVFFTILILGFVINLFEPSIPLAAAFALAAALAPTDAVSVSGLKHVAKISDKQSKLLQGESLLNDASSIVSFNFAVAAVITGQFSVWEAEGAFLLQFIGALVLGVLVMLLRFALLRFLRARAVNNVSFHVLFELITPIFVYLLAELVGVSGIIAVVAAGITHSFGPRMVTPSNARLNVVSTSVWSVFSFTLNGLVFLMLGTQLPYVIERVWSGTEADTNFLLLFIVLILVVILALRFLWIFVMHRNIDLGRGEVELAYDENAATPIVDMGSDDSLVDSGFGEMSVTEHVTVLEKRVAFEREQTREVRAELRAKRKAERRTARKAERRAAHSDKHYWKLHLYDALLLSLTGVKGAITLALMLSLPLDLNEMEAFPERDLLIFLASGVILLSLLSANIIVPIIAPKRHAPLQPESELKAILAIYRKVIAGLTLLKDSADRTAVDMVITQYYQRINTLKSNNCISLPNESKVRRYVIELQLENTQRLTDENKVSGVTALLYINSLSHQLARSEHHSTLRWKLKAFFEQISHYLKMRRHFSKMNGAEVSSGRRVQHYEMLALQLENYRYALDKLRNHEPTEDFPEYTVKIVMTELEQRVSRLKNRQSRIVGDGKLRGVKEARAVIEAQALDLEREAINEALEEGRISDSTAKMMRDNVAIMELDMEDQLE